MVESTHETKGSEERPSRWDTRRGWGLAFALACGVHLLLLYAMWALPVSSKKSAMSQKLRFVKVNLILPRRAHRLPRRVRKKKPSSREKRRKSLSKRAARTSRRRRTRRSRRAHRRNSARRVRRSRPKRRVRGVKRMARERRVKKRLRKKSRVRHGLSAPSVVKKTAPVRRSARGRLKRKVALKELDLRPGWGALRGRLGKRGVKKRKGGKGGLQATGSLWPAYHRDFYAKMKAMNGLHDIFYEKVAMRLRVCWRPRLKALLKAYDRRYNILKRTFTAPQVFKGSVYMAWNEAGELQKIRWKLPASHSPMSAMRLPKHTRRCLRSLKAPKHLRKLPLIAGRWTFSFGVNVTPPTLMKPLEIRSDPDRANNEGNQAILLDALSLLKIGKSKASFFVFTDAVF